MQPIKIQLRSNAKLLHRVSSPLGAAPDAVAYLPVEVPVAKMTGPQVDTSTAPAGIGGVCPPPGLPPPPGIPSHGSCFHGTGSCRPCMWFWKPSGCQHGDECLHCHFCPESEIAARRKRRKARLGVANIVTKEMKSKPVQAVRSDCDTSVGSFSDVESLSSWGSQSPPLSPLGSPRQASPRSLPPGTFFQCDRSRKLACPLPPVADSIY